METPGSPARSGCYFSRTKAVFFFCFSLACLFYASAQRNDRPVIGILAQEIFNNKPNHSSYVGASYVKFLESAGARTVPVLLGLPLEEYKRIFHSINGLILPGGSSSVVSSMVQRATLIFYELAIDANDRGDYFPMYGTCLGFELLFFLRNPMTTLSRTKTKGVALPLTFTNDTRGSRMFKGFPAELMEDLATQPLTEHSHIWSMAVSTYEEDEALNKFYKVLSTNTDGKTEFLSTMEAYDYPFYGSQWHPEKNAYEWRSPVIPHTPSAIKLTFFVADFFVSEARKSSHGFKSQQELTKALMKNYNPVNGSATSPFEQLYIFSSI